MVCWRALISLSNTCFSRRYGWKEDKRRVRLCNACGLRFQKGNYCFHCHEIFKDMYEVANDKNPWIRCEKCDVWAHKKCAAEVEGSTSGGDCFVCSNCQEGNRSNSSNSDEAERSKKNNNNSERKRNGERSPQRCGKVRSSPMMTPVMQPNVGMQRQLKQFQQENIIFQSHLLPAMPVREDHQEPLAKKRKLPEGCVGYVQNISVSQDLESYLAKAQQQAEIHSNRYSEPLLLPVQSEPQPQLAYQSVLPFVQLLLSNDQQGKVCLTDIKMEEPEPKWDTSCFEESLKTFVDQFFQMEETAL